MKTQLVLLAVLLSAACGVDNQGSFDGQEGPEAVDNRVFDYEILSAEIKAEIHNRHVEGTATLATLDLYSDVVSIDVIRDEPSTEADDPEAAMGRLTLSTLALKEGLYTIASPEVSSAIGCSGPTSYNWYDDEPADELVLIVIDTPEPNVKNVDARMSFNRHNREDETLRIQFRVEMTEVLE